MINTIYAYRAQILQTVPLGTGSGFAFKAKKGVFLWNIPDDFNHLSFIINSLRFNTLR